MIPFDKFGRRINNKTFSRMLIYGDVLKESGYLESKNKPNLFYKKDNNLNIIFFADMRGTEEVPIWEDPRLLFYVKFLSEKPEWLKNRIFNDEFDALDICRISYYEILFINKQEDGYCIICDKDFSDSGYYCSEDCKNIQEELCQHRCEVCGKIFGFKDLVLHHISYEKPITIDVCRSCHLKIHKSSKFDNLKSIDKPIKRE